MRRKRIIFWSLLFMAGLLNLAVQGAASLTEGTSKVLVININDPIHPITSEFINGAIDKANADSAIQFLVVQMDTPGGLMDSMKEIIKGIQASQKPVVMYVSPSGSRAASAGAFITVASHVAAMSPGTNIGSASPVSSSGEMERTMKKKVTNDASAYIRSLAEFHGRNADLAERFVTKAENITETEALEQNIIDLVARNLDDLLNKLDGFTVKTVAGEVTLATKNLGIEDMEMNFRQRIFNILVNPSVAYIFMMLGTLGLMAEIYSPGAILPGVVGAICLILGLYSMQALPINFAGVFLIILAFAFFAMELFVPSFGALTMGGVVALIVGSMMLVDTADEYMKVSLWAVAPMALMAGGFSFFIAGSIFRSRNRVSRTAREELLGSVGIADTPISPEAPGKIILFGEIWNARCDEGNIEKGQEVEVTSHSGFNLTVRPK